MKRYSSKNLVLPLLLLLAGPAFADTAVPPVDVTPDFREAEHREPKDVPWGPARDGAVQSLVRALARGKPSRLGFDNIPKVDDIEVFDGIPEAILQLSAIKRFQPGQDPRTLIKKLERLVFPLAVAGQIRSSVTLARLDSQWVTASIGSASLIRSVVAARLQATVNGKLKPGKAADYQLVTVTGLNHYFLLAQGLDDRPYLIPISDNKRLGLQTGTPRLAAEVIQSLVPDAKAHNGLPT